MFAFLLIIVLSAVAGISGGFLGGKRGYEARAAVLLGLFILLAIFLSLILLQSLIGIRVEPDGHNFIRSLIVICLFIIEGVASIFTWLTLFRVGYFASSAFYRLVLYTSIFLSALFLVLTKLFL